MKSIKSNLLPENFRQYISPALRDLPILSRLSLLSGMQAIIHDRIWDSVLNGELKPGAKVPELQIGEAFGVSRTIVRNVLIVMEQEDIVTLPPNRGAYIAVHSPEKIEQSLETAKLAASHIVRSLALKPDSLSLKDKQRIKQHLQFSLPESHANNQHIQMRCGMEFFILLAAIYGNTVLLSLLERLTAAILIALPQLQFKMLSWPQADMEQRVTDAILAGKPNEAEHAIEALFAPLEQSFSYQSQERAKDVYSIISSLSEGLDLSTPLRQRSTGRKKGLK